MHISIFVGFLLNYFTQIFINKKHWSNVLNRTMLPKKLLTFSVDFQYEVSWILT